MKEYAEVAMREYGEVANMIERYTPSLLVLFFDPWKRWPTGEDAVTLASAMIGQAKYFVPIDPPLALRLMNASQALLQHSDIVEVA